MNEKKTLADGMNAFPLFSVRARYFENSRATDRCSAVDAALRTMNAD